MNLQQAKAAAVAELVAQGQPDFVANAIVDGVAATPEKYKGAKTALGVYARKYIVHSAASLALVPYAPPAAPPPPPGRTASSAVPVDVTKLSEHPHFKPLGPEVYPQAPAEHKFSHLRVDHTISGFAVGSEEEKAVRLLYMHLQYETKSLPCAEVPASHGGGRPAGARGPFYTTRQHDHTPPASNLAHPEVLIYGVTQLSKTPEACVAGWCATFVDGCLVVQGACATRAARSAARPT